MVLTILNAIHWYLAEPLDIKKQSTLYYKWKFRVQDVKSIQYSWRSNAIFFPSVSTFKSVCGSFLHTFGKETFNTVCGKDNWITKLVKLEIKYHDYLFTFLITLNRFKEQFAPPISSAHRQKIILAISYAKQHTFCVPRFKYQTNMVLLGFRGFKPATLKLVRV